jgi:hypothetical protein
LLFCSGNGLLLDLGAIVKKVTESGICKDGNITQDEIKKVLGVLLAEGGVVGVPVGLRGSPSHHFVLCGLLLSPWFSNPTFFFYIF